MSRYGGIIEYTIHTTEMVRVVTTVAPLICTTVRAV